MITIEKILEILHSHSYNVEDQAGNHLIVVDNDSWDAIATEVKNCSVPAVVDQSEQLKAEGRKEATEEIRQWLIDMDYEGLAESL
jgi:hypothetical protein